MIETPKTFDCQLHFVLYAKDDGEVFGDAATAGVEIQQKVIDLTTNNVIALGDFSPTVLIRAKGDDETMKKTLSNAYKRKYIKFIIFFRFFADVKTRRWIGAVSKEILAPQSPNIVDTDVK